MSHPTGRRNQNGEKLDAERRNIRSYICKQPLENLCKTVESTCMRRRCPVPLNLRPHRTNKTSLIACQRASGMKQPPYRVHNSLTAVHIGVTRTIEDFSKGLYFPGFCKFLLNTVKFFLTCV